MNSPAFPARGPAGPQAAGAGAARRNSLARMSGLVANILPWLVFLAILWLGYGGRDLRHSLPGYGDALEITWGVSWYDQALRAGQSFAVYPLAFFPGGWHLSTFGQAVGPWLFLALLPLHWLGGAAFAYNAAALLTFVVAFAGGLALARRWFGRLAATVVALLLTFWSLRWFALIGHLNILLGSALLPWLLWALERSLGARRRWPWYVLAGVIWAGAIAGTMYFVWIDGLAVTGWLLGRRLAGQAGWRTVLAGIGVSGLVAAVLSAPGIWWSWQGSAQAGAQFYQMSEINFWGASLNSLFLPYLNHPWLGPLVHKIFQGVPFEAGATNLGLVATLAACLAAAAARHERRWYPALILAVLGIVLALGITLKWDDQSLQVAALRPLDHLVWQAGRILKPGLFSETAAPPPLDAAVPLPGMLLTLAVPFLERARVFARYALLAGAGVFLLAGLAITRLRSRVMQGLLSVLLVFEIIPPRAAAVAFPPAPHPAYTWLAGQALGGQAVVDVVGVHPATLGLLISGETIWSTLVSRRPTVAGASSVWPAQTRFLWDWLTTHEHPFWNSDLTTILRAYQVRYILLHMRSDWERGLLKEARADPEVRAGQCFDPPEDHGPWDYPICVLEVLPSPTPNFNVLLNDGWSGREDWGVWAEGTAPRGQWIATGRSEYTLYVAGFPQCVPGQGQRITVEINGAPVTSHQWQGCDEWSTEVKIPAALVKIGANDIVARMGYAVSPAGDTRKLSVGFTRLQVEARP